MKKLTKVLLIVGLGCIVAGGTIASAAYSKGAQLAVTYGNNGVHVLNDEEHRIFEENLPPFQSISVGTRYSNITLTEGSSYSVELTYYTGGGSNSTLSHTLDNGVLKINESANTVEGLVMSGLVNFNHNSVIITVPKDAAINSVTLSTGYGTVDAMGFSTTSLSVENQYGKTLLSDIAASDAKISNYNGKMSLQNLSAVNLEAFNQYGNIQMTQSAANQFKKVTIAAGNGSVQLNGYHADELNLNNSYGSITLEDISGGTIHAQLQNGKFTTHRLSANTLDVTNRYGSVEIQNADLTTLKAQLTNGRFSADSVTADSAAIVNQYGNITASNWVSNGLSAKLSNGSVDISGDLQGKTVIDNQYGKVTLQLPKEQADYTLNLNSSNGTVRINDESKKESYTQTGGKHSIDVRCSNGSINVNFIR